ncbi:MAG: hypothetical protein AAF502_02865 [Bacteroidota bacterium]
MRNIQIYIAFFVTTLFATGCAKQFTTASYEEVAYHHRTLAVLPFEMIFTGNLPRNLTQEMVEEIEEYESVAFQVSLFNMLHRPSNLGRNPMWVTIQHYDETNRRLLDEGISIRESWFMPTEELARILGVDAVIKTRIEKTRFMSDMASFGIAVMADILNEFPGALPIPGNQTGRVNLTCSILDGNEGFPVWVYNDIEPAYWNLPAEQAIDGINRRAARNFPYRERYN